MANDRKLARTASDRSISDDGNADCTCAINQGSDPGPTVLKRPALRIGAAAYAQVVESQKHPRFASVQHFAVEPNAKPHAHSVQNSNKALETPRAVLQYSARHFEAQLVGINVKTIQAVHHKIKKALIKEAATRQQKTEPIR